MFIKLIIFYWVCIAQEGFRNLSTSDIILWQIIFLNIFQNYFDFYYRKNNGFHFKIARFQEYKAYSFY